MTAPVALIMAGTMGSAIGARLVATGTPLMVFHLDPSKVAALRPSGRNPPPLPPLRTRCWPAFSLGVSISKPPPPTASCLPDDGTPGLDYDSG